MPAPPATTLFLKGLLLGIYALVIDYLFVGVIFHSYQRLTPQTWRPEGPRSYTVATIVDILFGVGFAFFFAYYHAGLGIDSLGSAVVAGLILWALFTLPVLLSTGIFVNWHNMVWLGLVLDWLVIICGVSALACLLT